MRRSAADTAGLVAMVAIATFSLLALVGPSLVVIAISFTERQYISFPPVGFTLDWYAAILDRQQLIDAAKTSLALAASVTVACLALGMPAAFSITRGRYGGRQTLSAFLLAPQMMPGMVIGIAMLFFGSFFAFRQSLLMMIIGLTVFCLPFVVRMLMARLALIDPALEEASANLGASRSQTLQRVTLPQLLPGTLAAAAFTFIEAFDNLTVVLFTASPRTRPLSVELYQLIQFDSSPLVAAISALEIAFAFLIVLVLSRTVGLSRIGD